MKKFISVCVAIAFLVVGVSVQSVDYFNQNVGALVVKTSPWVDVRAYGAAGDNTTDDTAAIQAAIDNAYALAITEPFVGTIPDSLIVANSSPIGIAPTVYFPTGRYKITSSLVSRPYIRYLGDHSTVFTTDNTVDIFTNVRLENKFNNLTLTGGYRGIYVQTGNVATKLHVENCELREQAHAAIAVDNTSQSTQLFVRNNLIYQTINAAYIIYSLGTDMTVFDGNWVATACQYSFYHNRSNEGYPGVEFYPILIVTNNMFTPVEHNITYVKSYSIVKMHNNRFGGEATGITLVENHAENQHMGGNNELARGIWISGNEIYNTAQHINFYRIPGYVYVRGNNYGKHQLSYGAASFRYDDTIPASDYLYHTGSGTWDVDTWLNTPGGMATNNTKASTFTQLPSLRKTVNEEKSVSDLQASWIEETAIAAYDAGGTGGGMLSGAISDKYGNAGIWYAPDTTSNYVYRWYLGALSGLTAGQFYTLTVNTIVNSLYDIGIRLTVGLNEIFQVMHPGPNTIVIPFYYATADNTAIWYNLENLRTGDNVSIFRFRIWDGVKDQEGFRAVVHDNAAPTSSDNTILWSVGDVVWSTGSDNVILWKCTEAGAPGTWQALQGAW